jgi:uncharacterized protein with ParB-like and HNH nuclease domain
MITLSLKSKIILRYILVSLMDTDRPDVFPMSIPRLVQQAVNGDIAIPEFQREYVWTKDQVRDLLDSLIKGYPIGSFLIWDLNDYTTGKQIYEKKGMDSRWSTKNCFFMSIINEETILDRPIQME